MNECGSTGETSRAERQLKTTYWLFYELAKHCNYGNMIEGLIRDRLVVRIRDRALSEKLQMDSGLTLEAAKKAIRQSQTQKPSSRSAATRKRSASYVPEADHREMRPLRQRTASTGQVPRKIHRMFPLRRQRTLRSNVPQKRPLVYLWRRRR